MKILEIKNLCFDYPDKRVLNDVSFEVQKGDFLCIVGTNGTGKTTLLKLILNIKKANKGEILFNGKNIESGDYKRLSYVSQKATGFNLSFPATVEEIVSLGLCNEGFVNRIKNRKSDKEKVFNALKTVGMESFSKKLLGNLSGGQQQRVFIAKALVNNPDIIFLDEPTVGIDNKTVDSICCLLGELNKKGITIIMVTHDLSSTLCHSNKVLELFENGSSRLYSTEEFKKVGFNQHFIH